MRSFRGTCGVCGNVVTPLSRQLPVCPDCVRQRPGEAIELARKTHAEARRRFGLPAEPPRDPAGKLCGLCAQDCQIGEGQRGYCGLRMVRNGRLIHLAGTPRAGLLEWYRDPLPTNCVADWVCAGGQQARGHNLAVFYCSCTLDCLFCQNWHYRHASPYADRKWSAQELADQATSETFCVCFFGGDPASQMVHSLATGRLLAGRGVRVCWETAGTAHPKLMDQALELALQSGGCIKFDLKAYSKSLHYVLTGGSNRQTLENFARAARRFRERPEPPLVVASTLLVPGYIDAEEVRRIASFIASFDRRIPYALLAFAPHFVLSDLPRTSLRLAREAERAAREAGLEKVRVGNVHLLMPDES